MADSLLGVEHLLGPFSSLEKLMRKAGCPWMIIGGMAAGLLGKPRFTADIDLVVLVEDEDVGRILKLAESIGFKPRRKNSIEFAVKNRVLLLRHIKSAINIDISLGLLPFEKTAIKNRKAHKVGKLIFYLPRPEDLIIFKAVAQRPHDFIDIQDIVNNNPKLDTGYIKKTIKEFADVLEAPEIYSKTESIIMKKRN